MIPLQQIAVNRRLTPSHATRRGSVIRKPTDFPDDAGSLARPIPLFRSRPSVWRDLWLRRKQPF